MGKPTLLVLTTTYPRWPGDTEPPFVHQLCVQLLQDFRVYVVAPHTRGAKTEEVIDGVVIRRYRYWIERWQALAYQGGLVANLKGNRWRLLQLPLLLLAQVRAIRRTVRQEGVEVIHAHWIIPQGLAVRLALLGLAQQPRLVCTSHGGDLLGFDSAPLRTLKRWVLRRAAILTTVSELIAAKAREMGVGALKLQVIPMGIATGQMQSQADVMRAENEILFIGRMVEKKGLPILLEAMALLRERVPQARLTLIGDGPMRQALEAQCTELALQPCVRFLGALSNDQLAAHYSRAAVFVAPSVVTAEGDQEGLPVTIMEALACHCPVVASALGGIAEVIEDGVSGLLVPPADAPALAGALQHMLADAALRARLADKGYAQVHERFDWHGVARRHAAVLLPGPRAVTAHAVCAVVVAYHPDAGLAMRLQTIAAQVGALVVVDNTPPCLRRQSIALPATATMNATGRIALVENADNRGIATALNQGLQRARDWGCTWLLTLDQDSLPREDMVETLLSVANECGDEVAVIGGNYFDARNAQTKVGTQGPGTWLEQKTVITSGSLVRVRATAVLGGFRDDYFIDQVDHEFCLRTRAYGGRVVVTRQVVMTHSVGEEGGARLPLLGRLPRHSALRRYYIVRNSLWIIREYAIREPAWCAKRLMKVLTGCLLIPFMSENWMEVWSAQFRGLVAGLRR